MRPRLATVSVAVIAALGLATSACTKSPDPVPTPTVARSGVEVLGEAAAKTKDQSFKFTLVYGTLVAGEGAQNAGGDDARADLTIQDPSSGLVIKANVLVVDKGLFMKVDMGTFTALIPGLGGLGDKWMKIDKKQMRPNGLAQGLTPGGDSLTVESYIKGVVTADVVSPTEVKGTLDLTKSAPSAKSAAQFSGLTAAQSVVPFTATLDGEGRVTKIVISMPASASMAATDMITTYSDYGSAIDVAAPASGQVVAAPALIYNFL